MKKIETTNISKSFFANLKLYKTVYEAGSMISLSNEKHLKLVLRDVGWRILQIIFQNTKETNRIRMMHNFAQFIIKFNKNHGEIMTTKYLKACQLAVQKKIAGQPFSSLREIEPDLPLPRLSSSGLPVCIKLSDRASICRGSLTVIRLWLTLFSIYRVFKTGFNPKINTITDPFTGVESGLSDFNSFLRNYSKRILVTNFKMRFDPLGLKVDRLLPIWRSSPSGRVSWKGLLTSFLSLRDNTVVWGSFNKLIQLTNSEFLRTVISNLEWGIEHVDYLRKIVEHGSGFQTSQGDKGPIGRLAFKEEAAGKLRVFAMVDVLTQSLLKPLHEKLFDLFRRIPNDGTHDQERAFNYAQTLASKYQASFGFDLSSATDRLPISSQTEILSALFGPEFGPAWQSLLVDRPYIVGENKYNIPVDSYFYKVGQPMGALSSWAMLNLTHHMMVQYCYKMLGRPGTAFQGWYDQYVVLGDDIVLFDKEVADRYIQLCKDLGVTINETKSIISSKPVVEFAKRTSYFGNDVSAFSFKEFLSNNNFFGRLSMATKLVNRRIGKSLLKTFLLTQVVSRRKRDNAYVHSIIGFLTQKVMRKEGLDWVQLLGLLNFYKNPWSYFGKKVDSVNVPDCRRVFVALLEGKQPRFQRDAMEYYRNSRFSKIAEVNYKIAILLKCRTLFNKITSDDFFLEELPKAVNVIVPIDVDSKPLFGPVSKTDIMFICNIVSWFYSRDLVEIKELDFQWIPEVPLISLPEHLAIIENLKVIKWPEDSEVYKLFNLMNEMEWKDFIETDHFKNLELNYLISLQQELEGYWSDLQFYVDPKDLRKNTIDNPLKILNFIDETVRNPEVLEKSNLVTTIRIHGKDVPKEVPEKESTFIKYGLGKITWNQEAFLGPF